MEASECAAIIEAILFVANGSVSVEQLRKTLDVEPEVLQEALQATQHAVVHGVPPPISE